MKNQPVPKKLKFLKPCLTLIDEEHVPVDKEKLVTFTLKSKAATSSRASQSATNTYKLAVKRFEEGTAWEYISVLEKLKEIWRQNSVTTATDKEAVIKSVLNGDSLTQFNTGVTSARQVVQNDGTTQEADLAKAHIQAGLNAVSKNVFLHKALRNQKQWMRRGLRKPADMNVCKYISMIVKINNALPFFPDASDAEKFSEEEIIEIAEWGLPNKWRTKFDKDNYEPTSHDRTRLIAECEAIERHDEEEEVEQKTTKKKVTRPTSKEPKKDEQKNFFCTLHGKNTTHNTEKCFALNKRKQQQTEKQTFSAKKLRKEINVMSKKKNKKAVLENYATVIKHEKKKLSKKAKRKEINVMSKKKNKKAVLENYAAVIKHEKKKLSKKAKRKVIVCSSDSSSSDSEDSMHQIERQRCSKKAKKVDKQELDNITSRLDNLGKLQDTDSEDSN